MNATRMNSPRITSALPTTRNENWKYANLRALSRTEFTQAPAPAAALIAEIAALLPEPLEGYARLVLIDGHPIETLSTLPEGLVLERRADGNESSVAVAQADRYFAALNARQAAARLRLRVSAAQPCALELLCVAVGSGHPALQLQLAAGASLRFIERHLSAGPASVGNLHLEVELQARAKLEHVRILQLSPKALHMETLDMSALESSTLNLVQVQWGGQASRANVFLEHRGAEASIDWRLAAIAEDQQTHDFYVRTAHAAERAKTTQTVRAIASGRGRIGFNGHMIVEPQALGADSQQSLRALLVGNDSEANLRPQLEIYTDAVTASHGATVGKLDADMLFYLLSRGIDPHTAEDLLKWAFIGDVLARLPVPQLQKSLRDALAHALPGAIAAETAS
jgi:Fe-S cluster assembly protein SufD